MCLSMYEQAACSSGESARPADYASCGPTCASEISHSVDAAAPCNDASTPRCQDAASGRHSCHALSGRSERTGQLCIPPRWTSAAAADRPQRRQHSCWCCCCLPSAADTGTSRRLRTQPLITLRSNYVRASLIRTAHICQPSLV